MTSSPTHLYLYSLTHTLPPVKHGQTLHWCFLELKHCCHWIFLSFDVFYTVWQVSCHTSVMLIIHTCLIITDTIGINQRIVTIINEWSNIWRHYHLTLTVSAVSWLTLGAHWPGVIPRLSNAPCAGTPGEGEGEARPAFSVKKLFSFSIFP